MRKLFLITAFLLALAIGRSSSQVGSLNGQCEKGNIFLSSFGVPTFNPAVGSFPQCTVTVYLSGTLTLAPNLYQNASLTPLTNPFTGNLDGSWLFFAPISVPYDVVMSGGSPFPMPAPYTLTAVFTGSGSGGGGGGPVFSVFGRTGNVIAELDDYESLLLTSAILDAPFHVVDSLGASLTNVPGPLNILDLAGQSMIVSGLHAGVGGELRMNSLGNDCGTTIDNFCLHDINGNADIYSTELNPGILVLTGATEVEMIGNGSGTAILNASNFTVNEPVVTPALTLPGSVSGTSTITAPATAGTLAFVLPTSGGTLCTTVTCGGVSGSGTAGFLPEFTAGAVISNSPVFDGSGQLTSGERLNISVGSSPSLPLNTLALLLGSVYASAGSCPAVGGANTFLGDPTCSAEDVSINPNAAAAGVSAASYVSNEAVANLSGTPALTGVYGRTDFSGTGSPNFVTGVAGYAQTSSFSGTTANLTGVTGIAQSLGSNQATVMAGVDGQVQNQSGGNTQPFGAALYARSPAFAASSPITNVYGLYIADQTGGGANNPNPHGIFEAGTAPNTFGGQMLATEPVGSVWGTATGGAKGAGTINVQGIYVNGIAVVAGGFVNPMTTSGDLIIGGGAGVPTRLPVNAGAVPETLTSVGGATALALPGIVGRAITGTTSTDTIVSTDCSPNRVEYVGSVAVTVTLPTATTLGVPNCVFKLVNLTTGSNTALTITPTTWTLTCARNPCTLGQGEAGLFYVDPNSATNWVVDISPVAGGAFAGPRPWIDVTAGPYKADPTGVADASTAIQSAFNNCGGGTVFFPAGTYSQAAQIINSGPCTVFATPGSVTINKAYNAAGGRPGANGSWIIESSNVTVDGIVYNGGQSSGFTGLCITLTATSATPVTGIRIQNSNIGNCDVTEIQITSSTGYTFNGPSKVQLFNDDINCPASANAIAAVNGQGTINSIQITNSRIDCSASTDATNGAAINLESQGLTTAITDVVISHNIIGCGPKMWGVQAGGFNAYQFTGLVVTNNLFNLNGASNIGCASFQATVGAVVSGNEFNANGFSSTYTALELIYDSGSNVTGNTVNWENPGTGAAITCNMCNASTVTGNKIVGFGETGDGSNVSAGIAIESTHNAQTLSGGTLTETGNAELVTAPGALTSFWQPGSSVCIQGATTTGYNICGIILNASYSRTGGTFTLYNPTSGLASCSGACTTSANITAENNSNNLGSNEVFLPCAGSLTNNRYGIMIRSTGTSEQASYNKIHNNTVVGCGTGATGDVGLRSTGSAVEDSNTFNDNKLVNLATGFLISQGTTIGIRNTDFSNVTTLDTLSGSPTFSSEQFGVTFVKLVACSTSLAGSTAAITDSTTITNGSTITGSGASAVLGYCNGTNWIVLSGTSGALTNSTAVTVSNPTAATDTIMMAISLPANYLNTVNTPFHITAAGVLSTTAASVPQVTITPKICSVAGCGSGTVTPLAAIQTSALNTTAITNATWKMDLDLIVVANGASCNFIVKGALAIDTAGTVTATPDSIFVDPNTAVSSPNQTCTSALFLDFFVQQSTTGASNSYKQLMGIIR